MPLYSLIGWQKKFLSLPHCQSMWKTGFTLFLRPQHSYWLPRISQTPYTALVMPTPFSVILLQTGNWFLLKALFIRALLTYWHATFITNKLKLPSIGRKKLNSNLSSNECHNKYRYNFLIKYISFSLLYARPKTFSTNDLIDKVKNVLNFHYPWLFLESYGKFWRLCIWYIRRRRRS